MYFAVGDPSFIDTTCTPHVPQVLLRVEGRRKEERERKWRDEGDEGGREGGKEAEEGREASSSNSNS